jgi:hypothetical protein
VIIPDLTPSEIARFYSKVRIGGCGLVWAGSDINNHGYGRFAIYRNGKRVRILVHRLSYKLATGVDPGPEVLRHQCDTPPCCTPDCLLTGSQAENIHDAMERGRLNTRGLDAYRAKRDARAAARLEGGRKRCSHCRAVKDLDDFYRASGNVDGRAYWCKACVSGAQEVA